MMICNENTIAMEEARPRFIDYIDKEKYYDIPLYKQKLSADAPEKARRAFEVYKENVMIVNSVSIP